MNPTIAVLLLGLGVGTVIVAGSAAAPRSVSLRERVIEAQRHAATSSLRARELAALWSSAQDREEG